MPSASAPPPPPSDALPLSDAPQQDVSLVRAQQAFARGDYRTARTLCEQIRQEAENNSRSDEATTPSTQEQAEKLLAQLQPSPLSVYLYGLTFVILCAVTFFAYAR